MKYLTVRNVLIALALLFVIGLILPGKKKVEAEKPANGGDTAPQVKGNVTNTSAAEYIPGLKVETINTVMHSYGFTHEHNEYKDDYTETYEFQPHELPSVVATGRYSSGIDNIALMIDPVNRSNEQVLVEMKKFMPSLAAVHPDAACRATITSWLMRHYTYDMADTIIKAWHYRFSKDQSAKTIEVLSY